jgi:hypothetical protein
VLTAMTKKKSLSQFLYTTMPAEIMGGIRVSSTADVPRGSHAHIFQLTVSQKHVIFRKFLVSLLSPDKHFFSLL